MFIKAHTTFFLILSLALVVSCGSAGVKPDDMSAEEHRKMAVEHEKEAAQHEAQYDPNAEVPRNSESQPGIGVNGAVDYDYNAGVYNPTAEHHSMAKNHKAEAASHLAAAKELETFEEAECKLFPPKTRGVCPLMGQVESVKDIDNGARAHFRDGVNKEATAAHIRCHIAYARTQGHKGMDNCPLYLKGVKATAAEGGDIDLTVEDEAEIEVLRKQLKNHVSL